MRPTAKTRLSTFLTAIFLTIGGQAEAATPQPVKMSNSGICHDASSAWYERTKNFRAFPTLSSCLEAGGREPGQPKHSSHSTPVAGIPPYDRETGFGSWIDEDGDCFNTRHETLAKLSSTSVTTQGCRVIHGRWNDPYTGRIFTESRALDIDHLVPLKWAWDHGAYAWSPSQRVAFANDPRNLFAVEAHANREKGADGPLDWLPPNTGYQCEYVLRFKRLALTWKLKMDADETSAMSDLQSRVCS